MQSAKFSVNAQNEKVLVLNKTLYFKLVACYVGLVFVAAIPLAKIQSTRNQVSKGVEEISNTPKKSEEKLKQVEIIEPVPEKTEPVIAKTQPVVEKTTALPPEELAKKKDCNPTIVVKDGQEKWVCGPK